MNFIKMRNNARLHNCHAFHLRRKLMASSSYRAISAANKRPRGSKSFSLLPQENLYSFCGKRLTSQSKKIMMNVMEYFKNEAKKSRGHPNVVEKVCKQPVRHFVFKYCMDKLAVLGISKRSIINVRAEFNENEGKFQAPKKRYSSSHIRTDADNFDREAIRRKIHYLYSNRENLTLNKILVGDHAHSAMHI